MSITVTVRKKHLDAAVAASAKALMLSEVCLVAQAVMDVFPKKKVRVSYTYVSVGKPGEMCYSLPRAATRLIVRFDKVAGALGDLTKAEKAYLAKLRESLPIAFALTEE